MCGSIGLWTEARLARLSVSGTQHSVHSVSGRENGKATTHSLHSRTHPRSPQKHERDDGMNGGGLGTALRVLRRALGRRHDGDGGEEEVTESLYYMYYMERTSAGVS